MQVNQVFQRACPQDAEHSFAWLSIKNGKDCLPALVRMLRHKLEEPFNGPPMGMVGFDLSSVLRCDVCIDPVR